MVTAAKANKADKPADDGKLPEMTEPGGKQTGLQLAGVPQRDEELEVAMVDYLNAEKKSVSAADKKKATYAEVKRLMREKGLDEYRMFDANETFFMQAEDAKVKHKPTTAPDEAKQTH